MVTSVDGGLRDGPGLVESILRYPLVTLIIVVNFMALGLVAGLMQPEHYSATAQLYLADPRTQSVLSTSARPPAPDEYVPQQADRVTARAVLERAATELGEASPTSIRQRIEVSGHPDLNLITVTATGASADNAALTVNAVASAHMAFSEERIASTAEETIAALQENVDDLNAEVAELEQAVNEDPDDALARSRLEVKLAQLNQYEGRITDIAVQATSYGSGVELFEPAQVPRQPDTTSPVAYGVVGGLIGLILAASLAYWRAGRTTVLQSSQHPAKILGAPLLGEIPVFKDLEVASTDTAVMDHFGFLLASMDFELQVLAGRTVMVTSAEEGEGKTTCALQLGLAGASAGRTTVIVDGDLRRRSLTERLHLSSEPGLVDWASGRGSAADCVHMIGVDSEQLAVLPGGAMSSEASRILRSRPFVEALQVLRDEADLVIVDSAPLLAVPETSVLAGHLDGIVVVIREGRSGVPELAQLRERLNFVSAPLLGYVWVTEKPSGTGRYGYGYSYTEKAVPEPPSTTIVARPSPASRGAKVPRNPHP